MEESNKLPLKRVELSLTKFNEVAIPHHLDLLRQHKANIIKYEACGEYKRVRSEQMNARRVAARLRELLGEMDALRRAVRAPDWPQFDARTQRSRDLTLKAIVDYLGVIEDGCRALVYSSAARPIDTPAMAMGRREEPLAGGSAVSSDSVGVLPRAEEPEAAPLLQLQFDQHELELHEREAVLRGWGELQAEVRALHDAWQHVQAAALAHREQVQVTAASVEVAADNVEVARTQLSAAEKLRGGVWLAGGAVAGALAGGPVGLAVGAKAGAAAALAGSLLGCLGARLLGRRRLEPAPASAPAPSDPHDKDD